jgi:hypothetical protein
MDDQKRAYFRAVEYKATSSKNFKEGKEIKGTQPSRSRSTAVPMGCLRRFRLTDLFYIRSVAIDWICCN